MQFTAAIRRIALVGFMGAGKSTLGPLLAAELGWRFVDVDDHLVEAEGCSIAELFKQSGEARFRTLEEQAIARLLSHDDLVLSLGGGALESSDTRDRLFTSAMTHVVFLETPLEVALARCAAQARGAIRPVLGGLDSVALAARFKQRLEHYSKAHQTLSTPERTPAELVQELLALLAAGNPGPLPRIDG